MSTTTSLMTFEQFERLPEEENDWKVELIDGELTRMPPPFAKHTRCATRIYDVLAECLRTAHRSGNGGELGDAFPEMGYRIGGNWLRPDVSITHAGQPEGNYIEGAPALAIEVISKSNTAEMVQRKIQLYLENGACEVWVFYPRTSVVSVIRGKNAVEVQGTLSSGLLPGLAMDLAQIFAV